MGRHALTHSGARRGVVATAAVLAAVAGAIGPLSGPAGAAVPSPEAVLDAATRTVSTGYPKVAGATGFAYRDGSGVYRWIDYASGASSELRLPDTSVSLHNTMSDTLAYVVPAASGEPVSVRLIDQPGGATRTLRLPVGYQLWRCRATRWWPCRRHPARTPATCSASTVRSSSTAR
ncbi:hypothetical protein K388_03069 [Streptomyces sp. KhCrAH-43]|uniref:hypothetical protein n=1 Tax=unclassified Streptomyces TaxID=2593676 RepID=UPI0003603A94|nr:MULTISPECIES: hypothetical protein [unclassified Streptomyces]MYS33751.1 hypothetical protein [Streptomyces sp. SID4920]MYX70470.1 hypothetical protein [Streptomyces sp. SID8373]RAJ60721.1 hypothetical protein K388_03069 [Streptomyces sp. KhCrAH-43]